MGGVDEGRTMLSEYEKRELQAIEEMLRSDTRFSARFRRRRSRRGPRGPRLPRVLLVTGVLVMVAAAFLGLGDAFVQGLVLALAGLLWKRPWRRFPTRHMPRFPKGRDV
jgi:Protein of unknown function (DUF3040)